jgi:hypothetical protein
MDDAVSFARRRPSNQALPSAIAHDACHARGRINP